MAVINRNTLVLNGVSVVRDVVTGTMGSGFNPAAGKTLGMPFSLRLQSQCYPLAEQKPGRRHDHADQDGGAAGAADWAGRPGCSSRVLGSLPASCAGALRSDRCWRLLAVEGARTRIEASPVRLTPAGAALSARTRG